MSEEVKINEENQFTFENPEYRKTYWHTCSHVLAQAVKRLWPEVKLAIGPSIDNGFYYDMLAPFSFTPENLAEIEAEMRKICKEKLKLERFELPRAEAIKFMEEKEEPFKVELINDLPEDAVISFYKQGEFTDLCAGPHLDSTGRIKGNGIKLTACNAAYWRGDSNREVLQRIYGVAFPKKEELDAYLAQVEEAKKRDHNKLGRELEQSAHAGGEALVRGQPHAVGRVHHVAERRRGVRPQPAPPLRLERAAHADRRVPAVGGVGYVAYGYARRRRVKAARRRVVALGDAHEPHAQKGEDLLDVGAGVDVLPGEAAQILHDYAGYAPLLAQG